MTRSERAHQRSLRKRVRRAFEPACLRRICTMSETDFAAYGQVTDLGSTRIALPKGIFGRNRYRDEPRFYVHQDNGADILGVAHLDSVQGQRFCSFYNSNMGPVVASPTLDDRLGVYVIAELLPALGVKCDWLLTVGEESCSSTAGEFGTDKQYNWIFSFDRRGTDVVMYDYETAENRERLSEVGAPVGEGSYSDICDLAHLGVAGFNWGVGYRDYHSSDAWAPLNETFLQVGRFLSFHERYQSERIEHVSRRLRWWDEDFGEESEDTCPRCDEPMEGEYCTICDVDWSDVSFRADIGTGLRRYFGLTESEWRKLQEQAQ